MLEYEIGPFKHEVQEIAYGQSIIFYFFQLFTATVDNTDPVISGCPSDISVQTTLDGTPVAVTWNEPTATDDSGTVQVAQSANPGDMFNPGTTVVTYSFTDATGNDAFCIFEVSVASKWCLAYLLFPCNHVRDVNIH